MFERDPHSQPRAPLQPTDLRFRARRYLIEAHDRSARDTETRALGDDRHAWRGAS